MKLTLIAVAVSVALTGCTMPRFFSNKTSDHAPVVAAPKPALASVAVITPLAAPAPSTVQVLDEYNYRLLTPDQTGVRRVFDDGSKTFIQFTTPTPPTGLMVFNENGKAVPFTTYGQSAVIDTVCLGLLIRTPTKTSYAQSITPDRVARVLAAKPGEPNKPTFLPAELAAARAQILEAQERLKGLAAEVDKASRHEPSTSVAQLVADIEQLQTQIAGITATMVRARFESNSTVLALSDTTKAALVDAAKRAQQVQIHGRTDATGTPEGNTQIALARAVAARKLLVAGGVPATKLHTTYRNGDFIAPNNTVEGRAQNRRVELVFVGKGNERVQLSLADQQDDQTVAAMPTADLSDLVFVANAQRALSLNSAPTTPKL